MVCHALSHNEHHKLAMAAGCSGTEPLIYSIVDILVLYTVYSKNIL